MSWGADSANSVVNGGFSSTQANGDRSVVFTTGIMATLTSQHLHSNGAELNYSLSADGTTLTAYTGSNPALNHVFTVSLSDTGAGSYTFTLLDSLDHPAGGNENNISINFGFTARDSDGDPASATFSVTINDDTPVTTGAVTASSVLDDDAFSGGNAGGADDVANVTSVTGVAGALFSPGADGFKSVMLGTTTAFKAIYIDANGVAHQESVTWGSPTVAGGVTTWTATSAHFDALHPVATLTINADGSYSFSTHAPLVHPTSMQPSSTTEENLSLTFNYTVTDGDNDTATGSLTVKVNDDTPTASWLGAQPVTESTDAAGAFIPSVSTGILAFSAGADGGQITSVVYRFGSAIMEQAEGAGDPESFPALTSHGVAVVIGTVTDGTAFGGQGAITLTGTAGGQTVFTLVVNQTTGAYTYTLSGPIDHPDIDQRGADDALTMVFDFQVTDGDGDKTDAFNQGILQIDIRDDAPTIASSTLGANLITNGQFLDNTGFGPPQPGWGGQTATGSIVGWTISGVGLERNPSGWYVADPVNGGRVVDLDASPGDVTIAQTLTNLTAGESYTLSFDAAKPLGFDATAQVWWNGELVGTVNPSATGFQQFSFTFTAVSGTNTLEFREVGVADNGGTFLANVQLHTTASIVDEDALSGGNTGGQGDAPGTAIATGSLGIHWGADASDTSDASGVQDGAGAANNVSGNVAALTGRAIYFTDSDSATSGLQPAVIATAGATVVALTSQGQAVHYQVLENGTTVVGYTGMFVAGNTSNWVFKASLSDDANGSYKFTLLKPIDHPVGGSEDDISLSFGYTARDFDGDTVAGTFSVTVDDDTPVATAPAETVTVSEIGLPQVDAHTGFLNVSWGADKGDAKHLNFAKDGNGNVVGPVLHSNGVLLAYRVEPESAGSDNERLIAYRINDPSKSAVFSITLYEPGNPYYTVALFGPLDHAPGTDPLTLGFTVTATDADGDSLNVPIMVRIIDDTPVATAPAETVTVSEVGLPQVDAHTGFLNVNWGADKGDAKHLNFAKDSNGNVVGPVLHSNNVLLAYRVEPESAGSDNERLIAYRVGDPIQSAVFSITLYEPGNPYYTVALFGPLDHAPGSDPLTLGFTVVATDADGDELSVPITVRIIDDVPVATAPADAVTVSEVGLPLVDAHTGFLNVSWGADKGAAKHLNFAKDGNGAVIGPVLHSDGVLLAYRVEPESPGSDNERLVAYRVDDPSKSAVFSITLYEPGNPYYTVALFGPLDHAPGSDPLTLGFTVVATDADGDSLNVPVSVRIVDDVPTVGPGDAGSVSEHDLTTQTGFGQGFENATDSTSAGFVDGGDYGHLVIKASGTDGIVTKTHSGNYALVTQTADESAPFTRFGGYDSTFDGGFKASVDIYLDPSKIGTNEGFDYSVAVNKADGSFLRDFIFHVTKDPSGHIFIGASNNTGFDPQLNLGSGLHGDVTAAGWYTFTQMFHDDGTGHLAVDMIVRDASGAVVFSQTIVSGDLISDAGGHRYGWFTNVDVANGIAIDNVTLTQHNDSTSATSVSGSLHVDAGADGLASLTFGGIVDGSAVTDSSNQAVTSGHQAVRYHVVDSHTLEGVTAGGQVIFTVTLDPVTGGYNFVLTHQIDHPAPGTDGVALKFGYVVTDGDGDTASNTFTVTVGDDVPVATSTTIDQAVNEALLSDGDISTFPTANGGLSTLVSFGADGVGKYTVEMTNLSPSLTSLTSNGHTLIYSIDTATNSLYAKDSVTGATIFTFAVNSTTGIYIFTQLGGIDHVQAASYNIDGNSILASTLDHAGQSVQVGEVNGTNLAFVGHTSDGDAIIRVTNDSNSSVSWTLDDNGGGTDYNLAIPAHTTVYINVGNVPNQTHFDLDGTNSPSGQTTVNNGHGIIEVTGGGNGTSVTLDLSSAITVADGDGDTLALSDQLKITVNDSAPSFTNTATSVVYEDGTKTTTNSIGLNWGADDGSTRTLVVNTGLTVTDQAGSTVALKSYGIAVDVVQVGAVLVGYLHGTDATHAENQVFTVSVDAATGNYSFTLLQPVDHTSPNDQGEQTLNLTFSTTATDTDGDSTPGFFSVTVDAAGTVGSIHYDDLTTGVFVNLADTATALNDQTVAANTATDLTSGGGHVVGNDAMGAITEAHGSKANDVLVGGDEENTLYGNEGNDTVTGGLGADHLYGGAGDDTFLLGKDVTGSGTRTFQLGDGTTVEVNIDGLAGTQDPVEGGSGYDKIVLNRGSAAGYVYDGYRAPSYISGVEEIVGTDGDDVIMVSPSYRSDAANGGIKIDGGKGNDYLGGGAGDDTIEGGDGNDVISGLGGNDKLSGGNGADTIYGGDGDDVIRGGGGNDKLFGDAGKDLIYGSDGADEIHGGGDNDELHGEGGDDTIYGDAGNDTVYGGDGKDIIYGGEGNDSLYGQDGNDTIIGGLGNDKIGGGAGDDTIIYAVGDGNDSVDGGSETGTTDPNYDILVVNGDATARNFTLSLVATGTNIVPTTGVDKTDILVSYDDGHGNVAGSVRADEIENVNFNLGSGNDTVAVGDLTGTGIAPSTVVINSGSGDNTFDLRNLAGTVVDIVDSDSVDSGDTDTVKLAGKWSDYTFTFANGAYTATRNSDHVVIAHFTNVEKVFFQGEGSNGATISASELVNVAPVAVGDTGTVVEDAPSAPSTAMGSVLTNDSDANSLDHLHVSDVQVGSVSTSVTANGVTVTGTYGSLLIKEDGSYVYTLNDVDPDTNALAQGEQVTENFSYTVKDVAGLSGAGTIAITVRGTNDAPVIISSVPAAAASSQLHNIQQADATHTFEPTTTAGDTTAAHATDANVNTAADMKAVVSAVQAALGGGATFADAIATVWDYLDDNYNNYYNTPVNKAAVLLGLVYADYVQHGGTPLLDTVAKYGADGSLSYVNGGLADGTADRAQSLHDNLLGSLDIPTIDDRFSPGHASTELHDSLVQQIADAGLTGRPYYGGYENEDASASRAWDLAHGLPPLAAGQLTATDVDHGAHLAWSISGPSTYGTMSIDQTGAWHFVQADNLAVHALAEGQIVVQTFTATVTDEHGATDTIQLNVSITGTNDAPVVTAIGSSTAYLEVDGADAYGTHVFSGVTTTVSDVDGSTFTKATITITDAQAGDDLNMPTTAGQRVLSDGTHINYSTVSANGQVVMTFTNALTGGTLTGAEINEAIETLVRFHTGDNVPSESPDRIVNITVYDDHGAASNVATVMLDVQGTNDTPTWASTSLTASVDEDHSFSLNQYFTSSTLKVSDRDADGDAKLNLHVDHGTLTIAAMAGVTATYDASTETYTLTGMMATLNSLLVAANGVTYTPDADYNGTDALKLTFSDNGDLGLVAKQAETTIAITVNPVNDAPVVDLNGGTTADSDVTTTAVEGWPYWIFDSANLTDVDSSTMHSMTVTLSAAGGLGVELLSLNTSATNAATGLTVVYNAATGVLTITGDASTDTYQTILRGIVYQYAGDNPNSDDRTVTVVANDGQDNSITHTGTIHMVPVNDPPVLGGTLSATVVEGASVVLTSGELGYTDPDNGPTQVVFQISDLQHGQILNNGVAATSFTAAELAAGKITFLHDGSQGTTASFSVKVEDGNQDGSTPVSQPFSFTVTPVNDGAATISVTDTTQTGTAPKVGDVLQANLGTDPDGAQSNIVYHWRSDGVNITGAMNSTYTLAAGDVGHQISVNVTYTDGQTFSESVTSAKTAAVISGNHTPVAVANSVAVNEDATVSATTYATGVLGNDSDVDSGDTLKVSAILTGTSGTAVAVSSDLSNPTVIAGTYGSLTIKADGTFQYSPNNSAAQSLTAGAHATDVFTYTVVDSYGASTTSTLTMNITGVNDVPQLNYVAGSMTEDAGSKVFDVLGNGNATLDPDSGAPNTVTLGTVTVYGGSGYQIDASDVEVTWTTGGIQVKLIGDDWNKLPTAAQLLVSVGYTLHGDQPTDLAYQSLDVTVTGVNDAPVLDASKTPSVSVGEGSGVPSGAVGTLVSALIGIGNYSDVDGTGSGIAVTGVSNTHGSWYYSLNGGSSWVAVGTVSDTQSLLLTSTARVYFKPAAGYTGTADELTFRGWDALAGEGGKVDTTSNGGTTHYSAAPDTVSVTVASANHAPVAVNDTLGGGIPPSGEGWTLNAANGHYYRVVEGNYSWAAANTAAAADGGYLATITSAGEQAFIQNLASGAFIQSVWLGASDTSVEGVWKWVSGPEAGTVFFGGDYVTGNAVGYANFGVGEPNNYGGDEDYASLLAVFGGGWNDGSGAAAPAGQEADYVGYVEEWSGFYEDGKVVISTAQLLANDTDTDGDTLTVTAVSNASHGTVVLNADHTISFIPTANYSGEAGFDYTISDGHGGSATAHVSFTLAPVNDVPGTITDSNAAQNSVSETAAVGTVVGLTAASIDPDSGDTIVYGLADSAGGRFAINATTGVVTVASALDYEYATSHTIVVTATDNHGAVQANAFTINVSNTLSDNNDTYSHGWGDNSSINDANGNDRIVLETFKTDLTDLNFVHSGNNLTITFDDANNSSSTFNVANHFNNRPVEYLNFDGGATYDGYDLGNGTYNISTGLTGGTGNDIIAGTSSSETLTGGAGNDLLFGSGNSDVLIGGTGRDLLVGGSDSDTFRWLSGDADGSLDVIADFVSGNGASADVIDLSGLLSGLSSTGRADHVRFEDVNGLTRLASAGGNSALANGDLTIQVNLSGSTWTDIAVIHDTGANLTAGNDVIKMMLNSSQITATA
ncbi:tandem-95 repeat protein [Tardiphaga sp. OK246]|uniref:T1SS-143 repeat domain-containing protein n=1 Tax=Tardiphaga sp. OK246 TaxID=1855307 RepID=UPI0024C06E93|nr:tandem-95 repeat protein [Tardiphaga sp. OK246]